MPYRILEQAGIFGFDLARDRVQELFDVFAKSRLNEDERVNYFDLLMLTAAEDALALAPLTNEPLRRPFIVPPSSGMKALVKWDTSPSWPCLPKAPAEVRLWDVVLYAGDMNKIVLVAGESVSGILEGPGFDGVVRRLRERYREAGNALAMQVSEGPQLDLLGLIWHAKASVLVDPGGSDDSVRAYLERLNLPPF